jgi:hypothetical protein
MARHRLGITLAVVGTAAGAVFGAAPAHAANVIQPGVSITMGGSYCTLNWIYDGTGSQAGNVYGGTAAHCVSGVGQQVFLATGSLGSPILQIGTVAYAWPTSRPRSTRRSSSSTRRTTAS